MRFCVVGAGAMGGSFAVLLSRAGYDVCIVDTWQEHVDRINSDGLVMEGVFGTHTERVAAFTDIPEKHFADWVIVFTDANNTRLAADSVAELLAPGGAAITMQNGIGNVEALTERLGSTNVAGGSSRCSAARLGPGRVALTHHAQSVIGELDSNNGERIEALAEVLRATGLDVAVVEGIRERIWSKFVLNCGTNALCAVSGLRTGEMTRVPEMYDLQAAVIDEALRVTAAKGIVLPDDDAKLTIQSNAFYKFNQPSMLQHILAGRRTEIDAINGALVREAKALGIAVPYNEALVALLKGRERQRMGEVSGEAPDYAAWEKQAKTETLPHLRGTQ